MISVGGFSLFSVVTFQLHFGLLYGWLMKAKASEGNEWSGDGKRCGRRIMTRGGRGLDGSCLCLVGKRRPRKEQIRWELWENPGFSSHRPCSIWDTGRN